MDIGLRRILYKDGHGVPTITPPRISKHVTIVGKYKIFNDLHSLHYVGGGGGGGGGGECWVCFKFFEGGMLILIFVKGCLGLFLFVCCCFFFIGWVQML